MGLVTIVLSTVREIRNKVSQLDVKGDPAGNTPLTSVSFQPAGDDANPLPDDFDHRDETQGNGVYSVLGFVDPVNPGITAPGEKRIYARDASGAIVSSIHLKNDGTVVVTSTADVSINGAIIGTDGNVTTAGGADLDALQAEFDAHVHGGVTTGAGVTGGPQPP